MTKTIKLTRADFLTKVANYEANPEKWEYLGDKPCIIDFYADWWSLQDGCSHPGRVGCRI